LSQALEQRAGRPHRPTRRSSDLTAVATVTALSSDSGTAGDFITNVASQTVSGTFTGSLGSGETIQVSADGGSTWVNATAGSGTWSASGASLTNGPGWLTDAAFGS